MGGGGVWEGRGREEGGGGGAGGGPAGPGQGRAEQGRGSRQGQGREARRARTRSWVRAERGGCHTEKKEGVWDCVERHRELARKVLSAVMQR